MHGELTDVHVDTTQTEPADFDAFWAETLAETAAFPLDAIVTERPTRLAAIAVFDVSFRGFGGDRVNAWLRVPRNVERPLPGIVQFTGYGNGRGHALRDLLWASAGYAHLVVDARGQGHGDTEDDYSGGPSAGSFLTRGLRSPHEYYYRRVFADGVRAVAALRSIEGVEASSVGVVGASQGGGIGLAIAGLVPDLAFAVVQAPFLCELDRATELSTEQPYALLRAYAATRRLDAAAAFETLRYMDGVNHAKRATAPAILSTGLVDGITPPGTVLPAFSAYGGPKRIVLWPHNGHEAGGELDDENAMDFVASVLAAHRPRTTEASSSGSPRTTTTHASLIDDGA